MCILIHFDSALNFSDYIKMKSIVLFDVDGTLTPSRQKIDSEMIRALELLRTKHTIGIVGGSNYEKQKEQLGEAIKLFDFVFSENGLDAYGEGGLNFFSQSFVEHIGQKSYNELVNFCLEYISKLDIPKKTSIFIELRKGMVNVSPIGRSCSLKDRAEFEELDAKFEIRKKFITSLKERFSHLNLTFSIGGQISFDVFPTGWDKTFCLRHLKAKGFDTFYFFGDKTAPGGNDHEIYSSPETISYSVIGPADTIRILDSEF